MGIVNMSFVVYMSLSFVLSISIAKLLMKTCKQQYGVISYTILTNLLEHTLQIQRLPFKTVKNMNTIENKFTACSRTKKSPTYLNTFLGGKPSNVYP